MRVIDEEGNQLGVLSTRDALNMAKDRGLDLVEVSPESKPPVCKILDYGKVKYVKKKREQENKKKQTIYSIKEIQLRPRIEKHDFEVKFQRIENFLLRGDKVKVVLLFRGREMSYAKKQGTELLDRVIDLVKEYAAAESTPKLEGRRMIMMLGPTKGAKKKREAIERAKEAKTVAEQVKTVAEQGEGSKNEENKTA